MIEVEINTKKFRFRDKFAVNDIIEIGLPLMDMEKYRDKITQELNLSKIDGDDFRVLQRWNRDFLTGLSLDKIDFGKSADIAGFMALIAHSSIQKLVQEFFDTLNPSEKKKLA